MQNHKNIKELLEILSSGDGGVEVSGVFGAEKAYVTAQAAGKRPMLVVAPTVRDAEIFMEDLAFFAPGRSLPVVYFPPYNTLPYKSLTYHSETSSQRIGALYELASGVHANPVVVTTVDALLQKLIPQKVLLDYADLVMEGEEIDPEGLIAGLTAGGYVRSAIVEEPGDFCVRGGIIDVFPPSCKEPVRIELFGDMVESLRFFSPITQRKTGSASEIIILPAREAVLKKENLTPFVNRVRKQISESGLPVSSGRDIIDRIKNEGIFPGIESLLPLIFPEPDTFFDYLPGKTLCVILDKAAVSFKGEAFEEKVIKNHMAAVQDKKLVVSPDELYLSWTRAEEKIWSFQAMAFKLVQVNAGDGGGRKNTTQIHFSVDDNSVITAEMAAAHDKDHLLMPMADWVSDKKERRLVTLVVCRSEAQLDRLASLMQPYGIEPAVIPGFPDVERNRGLVFSCVGRASTGFVWPDESLAVITDEEIFGAKKRRSRKSRKEVQERLLNLSELKDGDTVVHVDHGLGSYGGLKKLSLTGGIQNDFVLINYRDDDKLYLPVDRMSMIQKYIGVDGYNPVLDKMGGVSWDKAKEKARKTVEKIAGELLKLYAERKVGSGHAFSVSDRYFHDFEASFPYEETPDQLKAIEDVLADMERSVPMDRLVCGDVGYGKTEVALRASFKAVSDSKQVAILVPTTVLAEQHLKTFRERFKNYPVNVEGLSRFRTPKEQRRIIKELSEGKVDIIIGTHRVLQKDIAFASLGLVVVDEEQRFGVRHKEKLKSMRSTVDILTLTATPIPRTLHMSMMGVRDISIISTPPEQRQAILSYVSEFEDSVVRDAVRRELSRNGQVFFVHNNISTIWKMTERLQKLVPEARIGVAHGRLSEAELEKVMFQFIDHEIDMLVCTTIIESGLDIPAANTMLINRADRFGLAQIYQLRGRVGRGDEQAYAYLFIPEESTIGKDAGKRLKVLMEHSDLGSGFQIAMSDLQIRGGGSALGASQSGHIAAVGYDMFLKLMDQAVSELKGKPVVEPLEPEISIPVSAHIPETYITDIDQRLETYRRLARMTDPKEISDLKDELIDRFGKLPEEGMNMLLKIMLKILAIKAGVKKLDLTEQAISMQFSERHQKKPLGIVAMISGKGSDYRFTPDNVLKIRLKKGSFGSAMSQAKNILKETARCVNC